MPRLVYETCDTVILDESKGKQGTNYTVNLANRPEIKLNFQSGPIDNTGLNGLTNEILLEILLDRTKILNNILPCCENDEAIFHLNKANEAFAKRTKDRLERAVEGTNRY